VTNLLAPPPCRHITTSNLTCAVRSTRIAGTRSHTAAARRCDAACNADTVADIALRTRAAAANDTWTSCHRYITSPPVELRSIAMSVSVCLSVCPLAYLKNDVAKLHKVLCTCYHWPWLRTLWQQCNTLCTSGFVDDVMFDGNRQGKGDANMAYTQSDSSGGSTGGKVRRLCFFHVYISICSTLQMHLFAFMGSVPFVPRQFLMGDRKEFQPVTRTHQEMR